VKTPVLAACVVACALAVVSAASAARVTVATDRAHVTTSIGDKFHFRTTVTNLGPAPAERLIAHLNVLSLSSGTYVDPEDWSSQRTRYLAPVPPGGSVTIDWRVQAVNSGSFGVYVAALPASAPPVAPVVGATVRVDVAHRQTLNSGGILPLALGIPAALGALTVSAWIRRRNR
jgi:uncharacterized membrane protein